MAESVSGLSVPAADSSSNWLAICCQLAAVYRQQRAVLAEVAAAFGLRPDEAMALYLIGERSVVGGSATSQHNQRTLAIAINVSAAKMSGLLELLRRRGFVQPERLATDRRCQVWTLTSQGQRALVRLSQQLPESQSAIASLPQLPVTFMPSTAIPATNANASGHGQDAVTTRRAAA